MAGNKIINGTPVDAVTTNTALLGRQADDTATGILTFSNTDPTSGASVTNMQGQVNSLNYFTGTPANYGPTPTPVPAWTTSESFSATDNLFDRTDGLSSKFPAASGHTHDGSAGSGGTVVASSIGSVSLFGKIVRGIDITGATGGSTDVSTQFSSASPSSASTQLGVVVNTPYNKVVLRQATGVNAGDEFVDGSGNEVYARITNSGGVGGTWTLTYYVDIAGVETPYSFGSSVDIAFYYQQLVNPITSPYVYSEFAYIPSENATADVIDASPTQSGKVNIIAQAFGGLKTFNGGIAYVEYTDNTATGSNASVANGAYKWVQVINGSLVSIASIQSPTSGEIRVLTNMTGNPVTVVNNSGSPASNGITTGTGVDLILQNTGTVILAYDSISSRWRVIGGNGGITSLSGDVVATGPGPSVATIQANVVSNSKLAQMSSFTFKGNNTGSTADPQDVAASALFQTASPLTTKGDILAYSTSSTRFPVGTDNYVLTADSTQTFGIKWAPPSSGSSSIQNLIINGAFDYWQRGTLFNTVLSTPTYGPDRWYGINSTTGNARIGQATGAVQGSEYRNLIQMQSTGTTGTLEMWQVLDNFSSININGDVASFSVYAEAIGNVNQIGIQFAYATSEIVPTTFIGSEQTFAISSGTQTLCTMNNISIPAFNLAGVVGVRIRITGVSTGNIWDNLNGFYLEQAMLNKGATAGTFQRAGMPSEELAMCQRFYEKSYDLTVDPGTSSNSNGATIALTSAGQSFRATVYFKATKRASPTMIVYSPNSGTSGNIWQEGGSDAAAGTYNTGQSASTIVNSVALVASAVYQAHWTAEAEIY